MTEQHPTRRSCDKDAIHPPAVVGHHIAGEHHATFLREKCHQQDITQGERHANKTTHGVPFPQQLIGVGHAARHRQHLTELTGIQLFVEHDKQQQQTQQSQIPALKDFIGNARQWIKRPIETRSDETRHHIVASEGVGQRNGIDNLHGVNGLRRFNKGIVIEYVGVLRHGWLSIALQK